MRAAARRTFGTHYADGIIIAPDFVFITRVGGLNMCKKCWDLAQSRNQTLTWGGDPKFHQRSKMWLRLQIVFQDAQQIWFPPSPMVSHPGAPGVYLMAPADFAL